MAAQLWLLRHGEAVGRAASDAARELTRRGEEQARAAGRALAGRGVVPGALYASPKLRARRTAELAGAVLGVQPIVHEPLGEGFAARDAEELLLGADERPVVVVGHNPDLGEVVFDLTGAQVRLGTGHVAGVADGELIALLRPDEPAS
jgi:phosphohistidine phosphatase